jgi:hypothetical protein
MIAPADFEDRLAARLLGVDVDADAEVVRARFRRLVRAVHPDTAVGSACVDLGRLAEARDRLLVRAGQGTLEETARVRAAREQAAREHLDRLRVVRAPEDPYEPPRGTTAAMPRRRTAPAGRLGIVIDLAG